MKELTERQILNLQNYKLDKLLLLSHQSQKDKVKQFSLNKKQQLTNEIKGIYSNSIQNGEYVIEYNKLVRLDFTYYFLTGWHLF